MPSTSFAHVTMENPILNYVVWNLNPVIIQQHLDAASSNSVMRRTAIRIVTAATSKLIH
jgi:hypothetical protein